MIQCINRRVPASSEMNFYIINRNRFDDNKYSFGEPIDKKIGDFEKCEDCGSPISMRKWLPPFNVKLSKPSYDDFPMELLRHF